MKDNTLFVLVDNIGEENNEPIGVIGFAIGKKQAEQIVIALNMKHHGTDVYIKADNGDEPDIWRYGYEELGDQNPCTKFWKQDIGLQFMEFLLAVRPGMAQY